MLALSWGCMSMVLATLCIYCVKGVSMALSTFECPSNKGECLLCTCLRVAVAHLKEGRIVFASASLCSCCEGGQQGTGLL